MTANPIDNLYIADPETAGIVETALRAKQQPVSEHDAAILVDETIWGLSLETSFGLAIAEGHVSLIGEVADDRILRYRDLVRDAGEDGPTLGRIMATHLVPVLKLDNRFVESFLETVRIMLTKGQYTLANPLETLSSMLNGGDAESGAAFLGLLRDTYSQEMPYNLSLRLTHTLPGAVFSFSPSKRPWQIEGLRRAVREDCKLAEYFLDGMEKGVNLLSKESLDRFLSPGLEKFRKDENSGKKFLSLTSKLGLETFSEMRVAVSLTSVRPALNRYIRARTGLGISVKPISSAPKSYEVGEDKMAVSDGKYIYLPDEIDFFPTREENTELCKCLAKLESAFYEFGSFDFDFDKALEYLPLRDEEEPGSARLSDHEKFFSLFPGNRLAEDLFTVFEHGRIRIMLSRRYPGIAARYYPMLVREAGRHFGKSKPSPLFTLYVLIALGVSDEETFFGEHGIDGRLSDIVRMFERKMDGGAEVEKTALLVHASYPIFESIFANESHAPLRTPFGLGFRPDLYFSTWQNLDKTAGKIKSRLRENGVTVYKSDIRKHLMENNGAVSVKEIREIAIQTRKRTGHGGSPEIILPDLSDLSGNRNVCDTGLENASGPVSWFREWDLDLYDYLHDHVRVLDRMTPSLESDFYDSTLQRHRGLIKHMRRAFELLKPESLSILRQWVEGDEFDYRAMLDYALDKRAGIMPSDRLYIKRVKQQRDVAVLLLADLSRSTSNKVPGSNDSVLDVEKEAIVLFCEALGIVGDDFAIAGFSGTGRLGVDYYIIKEFHEPMSAETKNRIAAMSPQRSTRMGAAVRRAVQSLEKVPAKVRLLLILGDGFPNDADYKREYAIADTRRAIIEAQSKNLQTRAITVNLAGDPKLDDLYGSFHHNVISDVRELPDKLLRIYGTITR